MYENNEEINQKLANCIVFHKSLPFFILSCGDPHKSVLGYLLENPVEKQTLSVDDPEFNFRDLGSRLGYINFSTYGRTTYNQATYSMRQPVRKSIQGLSKDNVFINPLGGGETGIAPTGKIPLSATLMGSDSFISTLRGKYPLLSKIETEMKEDSSVRSRAFSRRWAIERNPIGVFNLNYKYQSVGYTEDFYKFKITDRFKFLRSDLVEEIGSTKEIKVA